MGDSYREYLKRNRAARRSRVSPLGRATAAAGAKKATAIREANRKAEAKQMKLW